MHWYANVTYKSHEKGEGTNPSWIYIGSRQTFYKNG